MATNKSNPRQQLKKYLVFMLMFLAFVLFMWLIFASSVAEKQTAKQQAGFNADIPDPQNAGIVADKKSAYEQEQQRLKTEAKMRTLQEYSFDLDSQSDDSEAYEQMVDAPSDPEGYQPSEQSSTGHSSAGSGSRSRSGNSFESSDAAYRDISRTLGNFYETPKEDEEKEELKEEVEQLRSSLAQQQQVVGPNYEEQLALLEKSYQLAAKYMPSGQQSAQVAEDGESQETTGTVNGKTVVASIGQVVTPVVSTLPQPMSDSAFVAGFAESRNRLFNTAVGTEESADKNTISVCVHQNQTLTDGQNVRLRLLEQMRAGATILPRNALISGMCKIQGERLLVSITSLEHDGLIIPVSLTVYDNDGQEGVFIPGSTEINAVKEVAANMGQNLGTSISITNQSAGDQLLSELGKGAIQGASQYISKKMREVKVHLKAGYRLMLYQKKN